MSFILMKLKGVRNEKNKKIIACLLIIVMSNSLIMTNVHAMKTSTSHYAEHLWYS